MGSLSESNKYNKAMNDSLSINSVDNKSKLENTSLNLDNLNNNQISIIQSETRESTKITELKEEIFPYKFIWNQGGKNVKIAGTFLENWRKEQDDLKKKLIKTDFYNFNLDNTNNNNITELKYIAGMDISASKKNPNIAVSALTICDRNLKIVYEDYKIVKMDEPYIPGFLAFREVNHLVDLINDLKKNHPEYIPQVILVDGNGILHVKGFGLACHLGVLVDIPTIGCSKNVFNIDGITKIKVKEISNKYLNKGGD